MNTPIKTIFCIAKSLQYKFRFTICRLNLALLMIFTVVSCQRFSAEDETTQPNYDKQLVTFRLNQFESLPFPMSHSRSQAVADLCKHIDLAVFQADTRVAKASQDVGDDGFGTIAVALAPGDYRVAIIAHNQEKTPTMTVIDKIPFTGDMGDTFLWSSDITVEDGKGLDVDTKMNRAVAMVRFVTTDNVPYNVSTMQFYYTGGSSTLDALTGTGCVNSRQTVKRPVADDIKGKPCKFDIYTFPKSDKQVLKVEVTGLDSDGNELYRKTFDEVPIARNQITQYTGALFTNSSGIGDASDKFTLTTDDEWKIVEKTY